MSILILDDNIKDDVVVQIKSFFSSLDCDTDFETVMRCDAQPCSDWASNEWGIVSPDFECGLPFVMGVDCIIEPDVIVGDNVTLGHNVILKSGTRIGNDVVLGDNVILNEVHIGNGVEIKSSVELRPETKVGDNCYIDSGVCSSGQNYIGDRVTIRYNAIIARGCHIDNDVYICPQVMTNNLDHNLDEIGGAHIGEGSFIGTNATLGAGIKIAPGVTVGAKSLVTKSIAEPGVYIGIPARRMK